MHVRGRGAFARPALAALAAVAVLVSAGVGPTLAGDRPTPREQKPGDATGYQLPFAPGSEVEVVQGWHSTYSHNGRAEYAYDFGLLDGTPVLAAASGIVSYAHAGERACGGPELMRDLNYVTIDHPDGSATLYAHLSTVEVKPGDVVAAGQEIGLSGRTGFTGCRPHLHFARQLQGGAVTQSIPVYFDGYGTSALFLGEMVTPRSPCAGAVASDPPLGAFCGVYAPLAAGSPPLFERLERAIDFDWNQTAPGGYWLDDPKDGFSGRWSGRFNFVLSGNYTFRVVTSGPTRVTIDGVPAFALVPDPSGPRFSSARIHLVGGVHRIDVAADSPGGNGLLTLDWTIDAIDGATGRWSRQLQPS